MVHEPVGRAVDAVLQHLRTPSAGGLVLLGPFGSGKSTLCDHVAQQPDAPPTTVVPLRVVARHSDVEHGRRCVPPGRGPRR